MVRHGLYGRWNDGRAARQARLFWLVSLWEGNRNPERQGHGEGGGVLLSDCPTTRWRGRWQGQWRKTEQDQKKVHLDWGMIPGLVTMCLCV